MLKKIIAKPHLFFFGLVPILVLISVLSGDKTLTISVYDIYFVITYFNFYLFSAIFFAMIGLNYFSLHWAEKPTKKWLNGIHISLQIISLLLVFSKDNWNWIGKESYQGIELINNNSNLIFFIAFLIFLFSVFIHLINFFTSLFLKSK